MREDKIQGFFNRMQKEGEHRGLDTTLQSESINAMIGRSMEAILPVLEAAYDRMGGSSVELPNGGSCRTVPSPIGPDGGTWRKALLFTGINLLAVMKVGGEPDPGVDSLLRKRLGDKAPVHSLEGQPCHSINVYRVGGKRDLAEALEVDARDGWSALKVLEGSMSIPIPGEPKKWIRTTSNGIAAGEGLDAWKPFFAAVKDLFGGTGLTNAMRSSATAMAERAWVDRGLEFDAHEAAAEFGNEAAREDGYLPGTHCLGTLDALDRLSAEAHMERLSVKLATIADAFVDYPEILEDGAFEAADGRNVVRPAPLTDNGIDLTFQDQHTRHFVRQQGARIDIVGQQRGGDISDGLHVSFEPDADGRMRMTGNIGQGMGSVHCWNGFVSAVDTMECCVTDELDRMMPGPGPG